MRDNEMKKMSEKHCAQQNKRSGPLGNQSYVDHTYHDFSRYLDTGGKVYRHKKAGNNFPAKLHQMLSDPHFSHIITWMPHGRAFKIRNKDLLMSEAVPAYFVQTKFESFTRQLSGWGFKRLYNPARDYGCYYHEQFLRGLPLLTWLMSRVEPSQGKLKPFPDGEPDFYLISRSHPLPSATMTSDQENCEDAPSASQVVPAPASATVPPMQQEQNLQGGSICTQTSTLPCAQGTAATAMTTNMPVPHRQPHGITNWRTVYQDCAASSREAVMPISTSYTQEAWTTLSSSASTSTQMNSHHLYPNTATSMEFMPYSHGNDAPISSQQVTIPHHNQNQSAYYSSNTNLPNNNDDSSGWPLTQGGLLQPSQQHGGDCEHGDICQEQNEDEGWDSFNDEFGSFIDSYLSK